MYAINILVEGGDPLTPQIITIIFPFFLVKASLRTFRIAYQYVYHNCEKKLKDEEQVTKTQATSKTCFHASELYLLWCG